MKKISNLTKEEKEKRIISRKQALRDAQILEAMEAHGYDYDYSFHFTLNEDLFFLIQPLP